MGWREGLAGLWEAWLPPSCAACDEVLFEGEEALCPRCTAELTPLPAAHCRRCGEPGAFPAAGCPRCRVFPPPFEVAWAPFEHEGPAARAIHRFKFQDRSDLARPLAEAVLRRWPPGWPAAEAVVPVPLHPRRFRERRYDQAALLAARLARGRGLPLRLGWLTRTRDTPRQVGLDEGEREVNVERAFAAPAEVAGARVLLVDDVLTTGATARAAAKALVDSGATSVAVVTVCRARRVYG